MRVLRSIAAMLAVVAILASGSAAGACVGPRCSLHPCCAKTSGDEPLLRAHMACCDSAPARATLPTPVVERHTPVVALPKKLLAFGAPIATPASAPLTPTTRSDALYLLHLRLLL